MGKLADRFRCLQLQFRKRQLAELAYTTSRKKEKQSKPHIKDSKSRPPMHPRTKAVKKKATKDVEEETEAKRKEGKQSKHNIEESKSRRPMRPGTKAVKKKATKDVEEERGARSGDEGV